MRYLGVCLNFNLSQNTRSLSSNFGGIILIIEKYFRRLERDGPRYLGDLLNLNIL